MLPSLSIPIPAVRGFFGHDLETFQTQIRPDQIVQILGHDPRSLNWKNLPSELRLMYEYLQRATSKDRREGTAEYRNRRIYRGAAIAGRNRDWCRPGDLYRNDPAGNF